MLAALIVLLGLVAALGLFTAAQTFRIEARHPPAGLRVEVGGGAIHVLDRPAEGEQRGAILLIHGASGNASDMFVALAERLAIRGFRVLSIDRPGSRLERPDRRPSRLIPRASGRRAATRG